MQAWWGAGKRRLGDRGMGKRVKYYGIKFDPLPNIFSEALLTMGTKTQQQNNNKTLTEKLHAAFTCFPNGVIWHSYSTVISRQKVVQSTACSNFTRKKKLSNTLTNRNER